MSESLRPAGTPGVRSYIPTLALFAVTGILVAAILRSPWEQERILPPDFNAPPPPPRSQIIDFAGYVGDRSCTECHPGEAAAHSGSGHSRTLWPAGEGSFARWLSGQRFRDPEHPAVEWSYHLRGKDLEVERKENGESRLMRLELGIGSGKHGVSLVTFVPAKDSVVGPEAVEHRFSYLSPSGKMEITPGQELVDAKRLKAMLEPFGRHMSPVRTRDCLACHATLTSRVRLEHLDPITIMPNVGCERCHGPGRDHIDAARLGRTEDLRMPMKLLTEPRYQVEQCGECHRLPKHVERAGLRPDNPDITRMQSVGLSMSACFQDGRGTLKCSTCHEVHGRTSRDTAAYESACLQCHQQDAGQRACPVSPRENCIGCHMPRQKVPGDWEFTNHWIRKPGPYLEGPPGLPPPPALRTTAVP